MKKCIFLKRSRLYRGERRERRKGGEEEEEGETSRGSCIFLKRSHRLAHIYLLSRVEKYSLMGIISSCS
jgi:hypothetical protein